MQVTKYGSGTDNDIKLASGTIELEEKYLKEKKHEN